MKNSNFLVDPKITLPRFTPPTPRREFTVYKYPPSKLRKDGSDMALRTLPFRKAEKAPFFAHFAAQIGTQDAIFTSPKCFIHHIVAKSADSNPYFKLQS